MDVSLLWICCFEYSQDTFPEATLFLLELSDVFSLINCLLCTVVADCHLRMGHHYVVYFVGLYLFVF